MFELFEIFFLEGQVLEKKLFKKPPEYFENILQNSKLSIPIKENELFEILKKYKSK